MFSKNINLLRTKLSSIMHIFIWIIGLWFAYRLIRMGVPKLIQGGMWTNAFERWGYPAWFRVFIGVLEIIGGLLLLVPRVRHFGAMILFVIMIGALITRIINGTSLDDALSITFNAIIFLYLMAYHDKTSKSKI
jgi:uncharacterized membrane protein YphA (DoxX/SURF4 family)